MPGKGGTDQYMKKYYVFQAFIFRNCIQLQQGGLA